MRPLDAQNVKRFSLLGIMKCPHCAVAFNADFSVSVLGYSRRDEKRFDTYHSKCPECDGHIIYGLFVEEDKASRGGLSVGPSRISSEEIDSKKDILLIYPRHRNPEEYLASVDGIPPDYIREYREAYAVLEDSPKASARIKQKASSAIIEG